MIRRAPTSPGPAITVATPAGWPALIAAATSASCGNCSLLTGSTKISMMPPQVSPTDSAVSSLTPYRCNTGWPVWQTCWASSYTAPSTHPPDTLPMTSPPADTARAAPGSLGALWNVRTTVARPNVSPASHHFSICPRMSRTGRIPSRNTHFAGHNMLRPAGMPRKSRHLLPQYVSPGRVTAPGRRSFDDLGDGDLQYVPRPGPLQRRDQGVDGVLGHHGFHRVHV